MGHVYLLVNGSPVSIDQWVMCIDWSMGHMYLLVSGSCVSIGQWVMCIDSSNLSLYQVYWQGNLECEL